MPTYSSFHLFPTRLEYRYPFSRTLVLTYCFQPHPDHYDPAGIRMNNVLPGYIETYETTDALREAIPLKRQGSVEEIAKTVAFLLSEDAGYITGQNIRVDGGLARSV